jgi:hypothetical protein
MPSSVGVAAVFVAVLRRDRFSSPDPPVFALFSRQEAFLSG